MLWVLFVNDPRYRNPSTGKAETIGQRFMRLSGLLSRTIAGDHKGVMFEGAAFDPGKDVYTGKTAALESFGRDLHLIGRRYSWTGPESILAERR